MLKKLLRQISGSEKRLWTETEIRRLISEGHLEAAKAATDAINPATPKKELVALCLRAEITFRSFDDEQAENLYREALAIAPGYNDAHFGLSILLYERGQHEVAFRHALYAKNGRPNDPRYLAQLGLCHLQLGNYPAAEDLLRQTTRANPSDKHAWNNLGIVMVAKGMGAEARRCFENALELDSNFINAVDNLARISSDQASRDPATLSRTDLAENRYACISRFPTAESAEEIDLEPPPEWLADWEEMLKGFPQRSSQDAITCMEEILAKWSDSAELAHRVSDLYQQLGEEDSGLSVLETFLLRHPDDPHANLNFGRGLLRHNEPNNAEKYILKAKELGLSSGLLMRELGSCLNKQDKFAEALVEFENYHALYRSEVSTSLLAVQYVYACEYKKALTLFEELKSENVLDKRNLMLSYASALAYSGAIFEALEILDREIGKHPNAPPLRAMRCQTKLLIQDFKEGWQDYRFRNLSHSKFFRILPLPEWQGEPLNDKTIVVLAEQGLGDQIMFASCLPDLQALSPKRIVVEAINRVATTIARSFPGCDVISSRQDKDLKWLREVVDADYFVPLGELPRHFRTSLKDFPGRAFLFADEERVRYWRQRLEALGPGPYLGASWRGGLEATRTAVRTMRPGLLKPLQEAGPAFWISLQYGDVKQELEDARLEGVNLIHWPEAISNLDEFAALVTALDGVFTVCNTTVHYAGAVGQRVWVLAPKVPEWRYGLLNQHMPWYPNVQVLRQEDAGNWRSLCERAAHLIKETFFDTCQKKSVIHPKIGKNTA